MCICYHLFWSMWRRDWVGDEVLDNPGLKSGVNKWVEPLALVCSKSQRLDPFPTDRF